MQEAQHARDPPKNSDQEHLDDKWKDEAKKRKKNMPKAHKPKDWLETIHHGGNSSYCSHLLCRTLSLLYLLQPASLYGGSNIEWRLGLGDESLANNADFFHCAKQASKQEQAQAVGNIVCKKSLSCLFLCCQLCVSCLWHRWQNYLWNPNWKCARRTTVKILP